MIILVNTLKKFRPLFLSIYLLLSFNIFPLPCKLNLLCTFYIFMFYRCCILCTSEWKYILDIQCFINNIIIIIYYYYPLDHLFANKFLFLNYFVLAANMISLEVGKNHLKLQLPFEKNKT